MVTQIMISNKKLIEAEHLSKKLMEVMQSAIRGDEPPLDSMLKHHKRIKDRKSNEFNKYNINNANNKNLKQVCQKNSNLIEILHKSLLEYMDDVCDSYAQKYGNECNLQ